MDQKCQLEQTASLFYDREPKARQDAVDRDSFTSDSYPPNTYENPVQPGQVDLNRTQLRSGLSYPSEPAQQHQSTPKLAARNHYSNIPEESLKPTPTDTTATGSACNMTSNDGQAQSSTTHRERSPIRVIPTPTRIREFSGSDKDYTAGEFITLCEDAINNSCLHSDKDKISFVRSRLVPGSRALLLTQSSGFATADVGTNFEVFKKNFLRIFGGGSQQSVIRLGTHTVGKLQKSMSTCQIYDDLVRANQVAVESIKALEDNDWTQKNSISLANMKVFLELLYYMFHIPQKARCVARSLKLKPGEKLWTLSVIWTLRGRPY